MNLLFVYHNSQARDIIVFLAAYTKYIIITFTSEVSQDGDWTCCYVRYMAIIIHNAGSSPFKRDRLYDHLDP